MKIHVVLVTVKILLSANNLGMAESIRVILRFRGQEEVFIH
jgi:hypothetical protein